MIQVFVLAVALTYAQSSYVSKPNETIMYKNNRMLPDELQHSLDKAKKDLPNEK